MWLRSPLVLIVVALLLLGGLLSLARHQGYLQYFELAAYDLVASTLVSGIADEPVVTLLSMGEDDIQSLGNWPLTDSQMHDLLKRLLDLNPAVLGLDIYRDLEVPPGHEALQALFAGDDRIVAIEKFPGSDSPGVQPPPALRGGDRVGFSDLIVDRGGVVRRNLLFQSYQQRTGYSLALRLALAYLATRGVYPTTGVPDPRHLRVGEVTLSPLASTEGGYQGVDAGGYQILLDYRDPADLPVYSLQDLLQGRVDAKAIEGRIVIFGANAESVKDDFVTPFSILDRDSGRVSGAHVHARAAQQIVDAGLGGRHPLRSWRDSAELAWLWLWIALGFLAGWTAGPLWRFVLLVFAGVAVIAAAAALAYRWGWWIPMAQNLIGWMLAVALSSALLAIQRRREQKMLMSLFSSQVAPQVAKAIWERREEVLAQGRVRPRTLVVTTLFTDLQGFTKVSEQMEPEPFLEWLNSYMAECTDIIMANGGVLDDYAGDGIKASFGVPINDASQSAEQAVKAVRCALALGQVLTGLNRMWRVRGRAVVAMRVGVHTGRVVAGTVGSSSRMKYTTVGNHVNLASRLESLKDYQAPDPDDETNNCRILISAETAALVADDFEMQDIGGFELKGIQGKTQIFQVIRSKER